MIGRSAAPVVVVVVVDVAAADSVSVDSVVVDSSVVCGVGNSRTVVAPF